MLEAVIDELARNREIADQFLARLDADVDRIDRFVRASPDLLASLPQDSVRLWMSALQGRSSFNADLEATSMLLQAPALDSEVSLSVRGSLSAWRTDVDEVELLGAQLDDEAILVKQLLSHHALKAASEGVGIGSGGVSAMVASLGARGLVEVRGDDRLVAAVISKAEAQRLHRRFLREAVESLDSLRLELADRLLR